MSNARPTPDQKRAKRVLVVDDHADSAELVTEIVLQMGHHARHTQDGADALRIAADYHPDVLVLDLNLPGMNGYDIARQVREVEATRSARIVIVTGTALDPKEAAGIDAYILKPFDLVALKNALALEEL